MSGPMAESTLKEKPTPPGLSVDLIGASLERSLVSLR